MATFLPSDYSQFIVTGRLYQSETRFRKTYPGTYQGALFAMGINLWRGSVYGLNKLTGKRVLLKRVMN
jgi:hypothetical protein